MAMMHRHLPQRASGGCKLRCFGVRHRSGDADLPRIGHETGLTYHPDTLRRVRLQNANLH